MQSKCIQNVHGVPMLQQPRQKSSPERSLKIYKARNGQSTPSCNYTIYSLVDFFHLGRFVSGTLNFLKWRKIIVITQSFVVVIDAQAELNHSMDAACKLCRLV